MAELRWRYKATLEALTPLRIGDGGADEKRIERSEAHDVVPKVATVFRDYTGRPYLPGTSLKGWLREHSKALLEDDAFKRLFGTQDNGGCVRFFDGMLSTLPSKDRIEGGLGLFWDKDNATCVDSHVVIDRRTGAAAQNLLFFEEYVPAGTIFDLEFEVRNGEHGLAAIFLQILKQFDSDAGGPARLGAAAAADWGRVRVGGVIVRAVSEAKLEKWVTSDSANAVPFQACTQETILKGIPPLPASAAPPLQMEVTIEFTGAFVTNDPSRARKRNEKSEEGNVTPRRLPGNQPYLPHTSLHGALRSQAEKIHRTLTGSAPSPSSCRGEPGALPVIHKPEDLAGLDAVSVWFGAPGWRSPIQLRNQRVSKCGKLEEKQEMIAIDRFTGGGANHRKFDVRYFWKPELKIEIGVDTDAVALALGEDESRRNQAWLLLALTLRDLADGLIKLGAGASKGFGACRATVAPKSKQGLPPGLHENVKQVFEGGLRPGEWPKPGPCTPDPTPFERTEEAGQNEFYNPYHFCPVAPLEPTGLSTLADLSRDKQISLDRYHDGLLSGYLDCILTSETPMFVGGKQTPRAGQPTDVAHYKRDGKLAIPSSTLRGLISTHFEALTNSSLRVLDNTYYSVRKPMQEALSALGLVVKRLLSGKKEWFIRPLTLPMWHPQNKPLDPAWRKLFPEPILKQYVGTATEIQDTDWLRTHPNWLPGQSLATHAIPSLLRWTKDGRDVEPSGAVHSPNGFRLSLAAGGSNRIEGIWRSLGCAEPRQMPGARKEHELFIPAPFLVGFEVDNDSAPEEGLVRLPDSVVATFEGIAAQVTDSWRKDDGANVRPYEPAGTRETRNHAEAAPDKLLLQTGDVVYFDIATSPELQVKEISFSSIWRQAVGRTSDYFSQHRDLLPMSEERRHDREDADVIITPAEKLFGFVESREKRVGTEEGPSGKAIAALRGRLCFSDAQYTGNLNGDVQLPPCTLKILSSPKPPCPAMYFFNEGGAGARGQYIPKTQLGTRASHQPKGRKFYLHHVIGPDQYKCEASPWHTKDENKYPDQKMQIRPVRADAQFRFRIHFTNLTKDDLRILIAAVRPAPDVRYKLGLGKPLGLGTVRLDPSSTVQILNVSERYTEAGLGAPLQAHVQVRPITDFRKDIQLSPAYLALHSRKYSGVQYPQVASRVGTADAELELYAWFVANDSGGKQAMEAIEDSVPVLNHTP